MLMKKKLFQRLKIANAHEFIIKKKKDIKLKSEIEGISYQEEKNN